MSTWFALKSIITPALLAAAGSAGAGEAPVSLESFLIKATKSRPADFNVVSNQQDVNGDGLADWVGMIHGNAGTDEPMGAVYVLYQDAKGLYTIAGQSKPFEYGSNTRDAVTEVEVRKHGVFKISFENHGAYTNCGPSLRTFTFKAYDDAWRLIGEDYFGPDEGGCNARHRNATNYSMNFLTGAVIVSGYAKGKKKLRKMRQDLPVVLLDAFNADPLFDWDWAK